MAKITDELVKRARMEVVHYLEDNLPGEYVYHNAHHTNDVFSNALMIGEETGLTADEMKCLLVAAIFHDTGYVEQIAGHEELSARRAEEYLKGEGIDTGQIEKVKRAILSTRVPQKPVDKISKVLCDADLLHLGSKDYFEQMELLRKEWKLSGRADLTEREFHKQSVDFFNQHKFHTRYAMHHLDIQKRRNLDLILAKIS
jgi:predicted metal-dependent HD superfamily phosphohydrolase